AGEAQRRSIKPIVLFVAVPDEPSAGAYAILHEQFPSFGFVPVENDYVTQGEDVSGAFACGLAGVASLRLPELSPELQDFVAQRPCSFAELHQDAEQALAPELWNELDQWLRQCFRQLRDLDLALQMRDFGASFGND